MFPLQFSVQEDGIIKEAFERYVTDLADECEAGDSDQDSESLSNLVEELGSLNKSLNISVSHQMYIIKKHIEWLEVEEERKRDEQRSIDWDRDWDRDESYSGRMPDATDSDIVDLYRSLEDGED